jgi:hypothetical protein
VVDLEHTGPLGALRGKPHHRPVLPLRTRCRRRSFPGGGAASEPDNPTVGLARRIFHGQKGELRQKYHSGMEDQLGALGLVLNCITLWNTSYLDAALGELREEGYPVLAEDVARLTPFMRRHINVHGHYSFQLPELRGGRRQLRDPDEPDDEED